MKSLLGIEARHLVALITIHEERSFRRAADRLGYVQSAVSAQISKLEAIVGARLVERQKRQASPVRLTQAGELMLEHARRILGQFDAAQADLEELMFGTELRVRVGVTQSVAAGLVPEALLMLAAMHPQPTVELEEGGDALAGRVEHGELDAAFTATPLPAGPFEAAEVLLDPGVLLVGVNHALARRSDRPTLADIAALPLVATVGQSTLRLVESRLRAAGHKPRFVLCVRANGAAQALVAAGVGAAVMPRLAVNENDPQVAMVPLDHLVPPRLIQLYWHEGRRPRPALDAWRAAALAAGRKIARGYREETALAAA
jgi:DNA-binding transcriptional LysR family regulator